MSVKPIKVLHVIPSLGHGGISTVFQGLLHQAGEQELVFDVIAFIPGPVEEAVRRQGGEVVYFDLIKRQGPIAYMRRVNDHVRSHGPYAAIHAHRGYHDAFTLIAARMAGVPCRVAHSHASDVEIPSHRWLLPVLSRVLASCATHRLACSREAGRFAFGPMGFELFHNALDPARFAGERMILRERMRRQLGLREDRLVLCSVGRLNVVKNHGFLLKAISALRDQGVSVCLLIIGSGPLQATLETEIQSAGLEESVRLLGGRNDVPELLAASDVFIMPSLHEGVPMAALEAQLSGLPCLLSTGVSPEVDLGIGAVRRLALDAGPSAWGEQIGQLAGAPRFDFTSAVRGLADKGYDLRKNLERLAHIYRA